MSIENEKDNIIAILKENGYDTNSPNTISLLSSIINSRIVNYIHNDKDTIIRILSFNEYKKYIINNSCDGSITKANENVWHQLIPARKAHSYGNTQLNEFIGVGYQWPKKIAEFKNITNGMKSEYKDYNKWNYMYDSGANGKTKTSNFTVYLPLTSSNSNNNLSSYTENIEICLMANVNDNSDAYLRYIYCTPYSNTGKTVTTRTDTFNITTPKTPAWGQWVSHKLNYNCITGFRPIFNFKDNNKSKNLYY